MELRPSLRLAVAAAAGLLVSLPLLGPNVVEYAALDLRTALVSQLQRTEELAGDTAVILMDPASEGALGVPQGPEWRRFHPDLIRTLTDAGARLVVFDAEFKEASAWDAALAAACARTSNVVAGEIAAGDTNPALAAAFAGIGSLSFGSAGGCPRWIDLSATESGARPLAAVAVDVDAARRGGAAPTLAGGRTWITYDFPVASIPGFSYADVLRASEGRIADPQRTPVSVFHDRIVLIGKDMPWAGDRFPFPNTLGTAYPGVYGQAYAVETLLRGAPLRRVPLAADIAFAAVTAALTGALLLTKRRIWKALALAALPVVLFVATTLLLARTHLWVGYAGAAAGFAVTLVVHWTLRRIWLASHLKRAMGFRPELIDRFRSESRRSGGTVQRTAAILCSDVRGYTRYVSDNPPEAVARVMGEYVVAMERTITSRGGYVNKYVGDEIIAVFGFPLAEENGEARAVAAALAMLDELEALRKQWLDRGVPPLSAIGIGVDAGLLTFTEVGGSAKTQFDIIGNPINGASRLQGLTKELGRPLVVSDTCHAAIAGSELAARLEPLGAVPIRGQGERSLFALRP